MQTAVLASGTGTILSALIDAHVPIGVVVVDRRCRAETIAEQAGIAVEVLTREDFSPSFDRESYTKSLVSALDPYDPDLVVLAGFGTILSGSFIERYPARVLNTHPALLPSFKGWHAVADALEAGVKVTGCTVHLVTEALDEGPILAQEAVRVELGDTEESLHERIKQVERSLYPSTIKSLLAEMEGRGS